MQASASLIDAQDHPVFGLAVAGEPPEEIAAVLGMDAHIVNRRIQSMVEWLRPRPQTIYVTRTGTPANGRRS